MSQVSWTKHENVGSLGTCSASDATYYVVTEEGIHKCHVYYFNNYNKANALFNAKGCARVMCKRNGNNISFENEKNGGNVWALNTVKTTATLRLP